MGRIITLTTDFGERDGFVGTMKGVILSINPQATIVDITHEIAPQDVEQGAFLFAHSARFFPTGTIHVVVVDPGVGSVRRPIAVQVREYVYVAPDNGVLTLALEHQLDKPAPSEMAVQAVHLTRPEYWLPQLSHTFHGRDIFSPVAAHISLGVPLQALGEPINQWVRLSLEPPTRDARGAIVGKVRHIDRFGNLVTNIPEEMLRPLIGRKVNIIVGEKVVESIRATYSEVERGQLVALVGSSGYLEIAVRDGSAVHTLAASVKDTVTVMP